MVSVPLVTVMTDTSINGWPVSATPADINVRQFTIPDTKRHVQLCADVAPILLWVGTAFHRHISNLDKGILAVWGYNYRKARQADAWSDHASGTAIDLRSDWFPIGKRNMSLLQKLWVRRILKVCDGLVIWGGDYKNDASADEMHFAIAPGVTSQQIFAWRVKHRIDSNGQQLPKK